MAKIYYGNYRFLPAPLISYSVEHTHDENSDLLFKTITYDLGGTLLFTSGDFTEMMNKRQSLEDALASGNKLFRIENENGVVLTSGYPIVESVSFDEGVWVDRIDYSASLALEKSYVGSGAIESFTESWSFEEDENRRTINVTHSLSAQGVNTSNGGNNALLNAKNYVLNKRGYNTAPSFLPAFTEGSGALNAYQETRSESVNTVDHQYEIQETFTLSEKKYTHNNSLSFSEDSEGVVAIEIAGVIQGLGRSTKAIENARYGWGQIEPTILSDASGIYLRYGGVNELPLSPISTSIAEDKENGTIDYSVSYEDEEERLPSGIKEFTMTKNIADPLKLYASHTILNKADGNVVQDLGTTTEGTITLDGVAVKTNDYPLSSLKSYINDQISDNSPSSYATTYRITDKTYNIDDKGNTVEFSVTWTFTAPETGSFLSYLS